MASKSIPSDFPPPIQDVTVPQMNDPHSPFIYDAVNSKKADPPGIRNGEFIVQHADDAQILRKKREAMKTCLPKIDFAVTHFQNWGSTISSLLLYVKPSKREDVCSIIKAAKANDIKVGMAGAYHSWSPTFPDSGGMVINTCDLVLPSTEEDTWTSERMRLNSDKTEVTLAPGVTTGQLLQFFLDNDVCFRTDVILSTVTYGGIFSGGCHGTGKDQPTMSDWITKMTVVNGDGELKVIPHDFVSQTLSAEEILRAASASLGMFGVIVDVTVEVTPMANARVHNVFSRKLSLLNGEESTLSELSKVIKSTDSFEGFWFPFNSFFDKSLLKNGDKVELKRDAISADEIAEGKVNRAAANWWNCWDDDLWTREVYLTTDPVTEDPGVPIWSKILDVISGGSMALAKTILGSLLTKITPLSLALGFKLLKFQYGDLQENEVVKIPWAVHYRDAIDLTYAYDMEFAFPIDIDNPVILTEASKTVIDLTKSYSENGLFFPTDPNVNSFPLTLCMEFRIMKHSKALLCPASLGDQPHILYIEVLSTTNTLGTNKYFKEIAASWMKLGGVPHWQKQWTFLDDDGSMIEFLKSKYGENLTKFKNVREALKVDPKNMFVNSVYTDLLS